ncbi:hypothetical protein LguiA_005361 [Lonicera macranthoides]
MVVGMVLGMEGIVGIVGKDGIWVLGKGGSVGLGRAGAVGRVGNWVVGKGGSVALGRDGIVGRVAGGRAVA